MAQGQISKLHDERGLETESHRRSWCLAGADAFEEVLDVEVRRIAEATLGLLDNRRRLFSALQENLALLPADIHSRLITIKLI